MVQELPPDQKGQASLAFGDIIVQTRENFPDPRYRPQVFLDTPQYHVYGINPHPHSIWVTADGIGTKPELAERLGESGDYSYFEGLAFDTFAMIESDEARWGRFLLGIIQIIDTNTATPEMITALARGCKRACDEGRFALLNGETAELGSRVSGYGRSRLNWNAVGVSLVVPDKLILGQDLSAGQPIVALRETSIRSNGLTKARQILEAAYLQNQGFVNKQSYLLWGLSTLRATFLEDELIKAIDEGVNVHQQFNEAIDRFNKRFGHDIVEQTLLPWHQLFPEVTSEILRPSVLYGKLINEAQGWVDGEKQVQIIAAAHISGGGIPEKVRRMLEMKRLGAHIDAIFPDPKGVESLLQIAQTLPNEGQHLIDDRTACQQWNRGIGFVVVTKTTADAYDLIDMAKKMGYEAAVAGKILKEPKIEFRGHTWAY